ncbi:hypothetical protein PAECIP111890_00429 [Paenibacillus sp. JJ-223]|nr:hypothetical protein PAECIP111890_00429 [Paenibacillus sp. JJ-223]
MKIKNLLEALAQVGGVAMSNGESSNHKNRFID